MDEQPNPHSLLPAIKITQDEDKKQFDQANAGFRKRNNRASDYYLSTRPPADKEEE